MRNVTKNSNLFTALQIFRYRPTELGLITVVIVHAQVRTTDNLLTFLQVDPNKWPFQVNATNMSRYCKCAGNFSHTLSVDDFYNKLKTFRNVAR